MGPFSVQKSGRGAAGVGGARAATITRINDIAVYPLARRRTADAETSVTFEIESKIASDTTANGVDVQDATVSYMMNQLQQDINQAATSGSIVANILTQAIDSGVLTNELKAMPLSQQVSMTRTVKTKEVDVNVPMSSTATYADHAHHLAWYELIQCPPSQAPLHDSCLPLKRELARVSPPTYISVAVRAP